MPSQRERERYVYIGVSSQVLRHSGGVKDAWFIMFLNELPLGNDQLFEDQRACPNRGVDGALSGGHVWRYIYQSINIYICVCVSHSTDIWTYMGLWGHASTILWMKQVW
jgi:hypothetical protein